MKKNKLTSVSLIIFFLLILAACSQTKFLPTPTAEMPLLDSSTPLLDDIPNVANGELIYFTATSKRGGQITYTGGPAFGGMMMGTYLTCASCHGPGARGGKHIMHMVVMDAPDIRYTSLLHELEEHGSGHNEYDLDTFRLAVLGGQHPDGDELDSNMPRWQISDANLADLFAFLQSLS